jgi:hypothetical protein
VLNASREVFGLFGVTVLGAILGARQSALAQTGLPSQVAFLAGYQLALIVAALMVAAGIPLSLHTFRRHTHAATPAPAGHPLAGHHNAPAPQASVQAA